MQKEQEENGEVQINLGEIFSFYLQKWFFILLALVVGAVGGFLVGSFLPKYYTEDAAYCVSYAGTESGDTDVTQVATSQSAVSKILLTCVELTQYNVFQEALVETLKDYGYEYEEEDIAQYVTVTSSVTSSTSTSTYTSNCIYVSVKTKSAQESYDIMSAFLAMYPDFVYNNYKLAGDAELVFSPISYTIPAEKLEGVRAVGRTTCTIIGALGCTVVMLVVLAVICITDSRVKSEEELIEKYGAAILAGIPDYYDKNLGGGTYNYYSHNSKWL